MKKACVYTHTNTLTGKVFYVGKANDSKSRPYQRNTSSRSAKWVEYVSRELGGDTGKIKVTIIECSDEGEALKREWGMIRALKPETNTQYVEDVEVQSVDLEDLFKAVFCGEIEVFHKTAMGDLTQLWRVGNASRASEGKRPPNITHFLNSKSTQEFIDICKEENHGNPVIEKTGKGKNARTYASVHFLIYAAEYLSARFHYQVIDVFVNQKILEYRDSGGDKFKALNMVIDNKLPGREGKSNKGIYIQVAKMLRDKCELGDRSWNTATADELRQRDSLEQKIADILDLNLVKDWDHLKELIEKM